MSTTWRFAGVLFGVVFVAAGCDKSSTTPPPGKPQDETYGKKLVGVWEGTPEDAPKSLTITVEFKADNGFKMTMGAEKDRFESTGTWKLVKEEGKTLTVETEATYPFQDPKGPKKTEKKTLSVEFEDAETIVISSVEGKQDRLKLKRKS